MQLTTTTTISFNLQSLVGLLFGNFYWFLLFLINSIFAYIGHAMYYYK